MDSEYFRLCLESNGLGQLARFLSAEFLDTIRHGDWPRWREQLAQLPEISPVSPTAGDAVHIGAATELSAPEVALLEQQLKAFIPWRKGPFSLFGVPIDSEWRCEIKWSRLTPAISSLAGRKVLDVGSGNGYFSLQMQLAGAEVVVGLEPHIAYCAQFWALQRYLEDTPVFILPIPLEDVPRPLPVFDTVFSMGVIYHRRSPIDHLQQLKDCLRPGGELVMESIVVDGPNGYSLTPDKKYARMSNVWFVPSSQTLMQWLRRCGFVNIRLVDESVTTESEQRVTEWMPFESLESALDATDPRLTIENYPAPKRAIILAEKA